ncbi:MAG: SufE family protein [Candidatus Hodarchaeales archaeon]|jgi:cysteine desulfuration protein SufE
MIIDDIQKQIVEEFSTFDDWLDKYEYLISLGKKLDPLDDKFKTEEFAIKGCQSRVWVVANVNEDRMIIKGDSDGLITKGILSLLIRVFNNQKLTDISSTHVFFTEKSGLSKNLSPSRANGMGSMIKQIKYLAKKYL